MARPFSPEMTVTTPRSVTRFSETEQFSNPLYDGADPYVIRHGETYYGCKAGPGGCIEVYQSDSLIDLGRRTVVWAPPRYGWNRAQVWAPELHYVRGQWYIYYAASNGRNENHRMGVLRSYGEDATGPYEDLGQMYTGDDLAGKTDNRWAIDGTIFEQDDQLYFVWSGWQDHTDVQYLYIATMSDPATISSDRVRLCGNNCHEWEHVGETRRERGLNEGPAILNRFGKWMIVYSCSGSWEVSYKLGMITMPQGSDPMVATNWTKHHEPVLQPTRDVFGIGHCSFTTSLDGTEDWILFHSKKSRSHGWDRHVHAQRFGWTMDGMPDFSRPLHSDSKRPVPSTPTRTPVRKVA